MSDTVRTLSALQTLLADNTSGQISPQDLRDFLVSAHLKNLVTKTTDYTADADDDVILLDGTSSTVEITLPTASGILGKKYCLKCIDSTNACTVAPEASETIDGESNYTFINEDDAIIIVSDGNNWKIVSNYRTYTNFSYDDSASTESYTNNTEHTIISRAITITKTSDILVMAKCSIRSATYIRNCQGRIYLDSTQKDLTTTYLSAGGEEGTNMCIANLTSVAPGSYTIYYKITMATGSTFTSTTDFHRMTTTITSK